MRRGVIGTVVVIAACAGGASNSPETATPSVDRRAEDQSPEGKARAELAQAQRGLDRALPPIQGGGGEDTRAGEATPQVQTSPSPSPPAAGNNCTAACQALASLERAAAHLCALSDAAECADAKTRVERARDRVVKACGACR